jgi:hypothetical protein
LNTWYKSRRFVVSQVLKMKKTENNYLFWKAKRTVIFFYVTNMELSPEEVVEFYQKGGNCEDYIKAAKYFSAVQD